MAAWSVVNGEKPAKAANTDERRPAKNFRVAVLALATLVVLSLGLTLIPADPPAPPPPSATELARADAYDEALAIRSDSLRLTNSGAVDGAAAATLDDVVTLLTFQARALQDPAAPALVTAVPVTGPAGSVESSQQSHTPTPTQSATPRSAPTPPALASTLAASARTRLQDARTVDGGMARLLASAGVAQLLAAEKLAAAVGAPEAAAAPAPPTATSPTAPTDSSAAPPAGSGTAPASGKAAATSGATPLACLPASTGTASPSPAATRTPNAGTALTVPPDAGQAFSVLAQRGHQAVYAYQVALTRLNAAQRGPASTFLAEHRRGAEEAAAHSRLDCGTPPSPQPGYAIGGQFLADPAAGLAAFEGSSLAAYGDAIAVSAATQREWAVSGLLSAARRTNAWGGNVGHLPGLVLDENALPALSPPTP
ncbi:hypothetical protein PSET11_02534 [Arthrobacter ulcerisalmonis]|uniref:DUF4439 domain-containing protein n=1 Tax=Arthrobacter ulcerisalmonis TaxID=2483813 RepID=A0A3P5XJT1_9MICC|nr:hypothetical protein PSET11_02534 [Arthrobacter ulcerisalmonis]